MRHILFFILFIEALSACKQSEIEDQSSLSAVTQIGAVKFDLTTYKGAGPKEYLAMKREMSNEIKPDAYLEFEDLVEAEKIVNSKLTREEIIALKFYTYEPYKKLNSALRTKTPAELVNFGSTIKTISTALNKLDKKSCTTYRGMTRTAGTDAFVNNSAKVKRLIEKAFMSTSDLATAKTYAGSNGYILEIKSARCRDITFVWGKQLTEIVFPPGTEFEVENDPPAKGYFSRSLTTLELSEVVVKDPDFVPVTTGPQKNITPVIVGKLAKFPTGPLPTSRKKTSLHEFSPAEAETVPGESPASK